MLSNAVGIEESAGQVNNFIATPEHNQARFFGNVGNNSCFQVFFVSIFDEGIAVSGSDNNSHTLLRFGDSQLGAVQAFVFFGNLVEVDNKTVGQLADSNGYTACTEVVAAFDHCGYGRVAEQTLDFAFGWRITLLYLCAAAHEGVNGVLLGGTGCTAAAVTAGFAAQQHYDIAGSGTLTANCATGSSADYAADFHTLRNKFIMIVFLYMAGCQTDLVAVGAVACSCADGNLALRQLTGQGFADWGARVGTAGYTHSLIYIGTAGQRIADCTAEAGCSAAERFDFGRMVMGFVFEHYQPLFSLAVDFDRHNDRACVDFFGLVKVSQLAFIAQLLHADYGNVHQCYRTFGVFTVNLVTGSHVFVISLLYRLGKGAGNDIYIFNLRHEGGMTAVVGPVGIQHTDFGNSRFTVFFVEVFLAPQQVVQAHSQAHGLAQCFCFFLGHGQETGNGFNLFRLFAGADEGFRLSLLSLTRFNRVDAVSLDFFNFFRSQLAFQHIYLSSSNHRALLLGNKLDTLFGKILALVILTGQQLYGKGSLACSQRQFLLYDIVDRRLGQHQLFSHSEFLIAQAHHIIAVNNTHTGKIAHTEVVAQVCQQAMCFDSKGILLFYKKSSNVTHIHGLQCNFFEVNTCYLCIYFNTLRRFIQYG